MENKFKVGDMVKIPQTKTANGWEGHAWDSVVVRAARRNMQDYLYVTGYDYEDNNYMLDSIETSETGDYFHENDLELYEESNLDKVIVVNPIPKSKLPEFSVEGLDDCEVQDTSLYTIYSKDKSFYYEVVKLLEYLASTYGDKYEESSKYVFVPKEGLTKEVALWNTSKYLRRYSTTGFAKSEDTKDVLKAIHYLLMENKRKNNADRS